MSDIKEKDLVLVGGPDDPKCHFQKYDGTIEGGSVSMPKSIG